MKEKMDELIGQRFGKLVVTEIIKNVKFKRPVCHCDCGKEGFITTRADLVKGRVTSCGCEEQPTNYDDLVGNKFGKLTVIKAIQEHNHLVFICECDCGKKIKTTKKVLIEGKIKSCGCDRKKAYPKGLFVKYIPTSQELVGKKYNNLLVIEAIDKLSVKCKCECCGQERIYRKHYLLSGRPKSCGCLYSASFGIFVKNHIGLRHEMLTIVDVLDKKHVICKCDCGNIVKMPLNSFRLRKSCGCTSITKWTQQKNETIVPYINKKFNKLTILRPSENNRKTRVKNVICKCDCGTIVEKRFTNVIEGKTKSCGCMISENINRMRNVSKL